jgi:hypothetical protein
MAPKDAIAFQLLIEILAPDSGAKVLVLTEERSASLR